MFDLLSPLILVYAYYLDQYSCVFQVYVVSIWLLGVILWSFFLYDISLSFLSTYELWEIIRIEVVYFGVVLMCSAFLGRDRVKHTICYITPFISAFRLVYFSPFSLKEVFQCTLIVRKLTYSRDLAYVQVPQLGGCFHVSQGCL